MSRPRLDPKQRTVGVTIYPTIAQSRKLRALSTKTKVPKSEYIREGIALLLQKHSRKDRR